MPVGRPGDDWGARLKRVDSEMTSSFSDASMPASSCDASSSIDLDLALRLSSLVASASTRLSSVAQPVTLVVAGGLSAPAFLRPKTPLLLRAGGACCRTTLIASSCTTRGASARSASIT